MAKSLFNEAEAYLLDNWVDARQLERSLQRMGKKYREVLGTVLNEVSNRHPELDCRGMDLEMDEDDDEACDCLNLGIGRKAWPSMNPRTYPTGLWVSGITLGELITRGATAASACVWINPPEDSKLDLQESLRVLQEEAKRAVPEIEIHADVNKSEGSVSIDYPIPEPRKRLLELLLEKESLGFIQCMVAHFDTLAKFIPVIDKMFQDKQRSRR
jgi:hypothetical protein